MENSSLDELVDQHRKGDPTAFARIIDCTTPALYRYVRRHCVDHHDAEDLLQDVFAHAWKYFDGYRKPENLIGWLEAIARQKQSRTWQRQKNKPPPKRLPEFTAADEPDSEPAANKASHDATQDLDEDARLAVAVQKLPQFEKSVIRLILEWGLSIRDVAGVLKKRAPYVHAAYNRAVARLRRTLLLGELEQLSREQQRERLLDECQKIERMIGSLLSVWLSHASHVRALTGARDLVRFAGEIGLRVLVTEAPFTGLMSDENPVWMSHRVLRKIKPEAVIDLAERLKASIATILRHEIHSARQNAQADSSIQLAQLAETILTRERLELLLKKLAAIKVQDLSLRLETELQRSGALLAGLNRMSLPADRAIKQQAQLVLTYKIAARRLRLGVDCETSSKLKSDPAKLDCAFQLLRAAISEHGESMIAATYKSLYDCHSNGEDRDSLRKCLARVGRFIRSVSPLLLDANQP